MEALGTDRTASAVVQDPRVQKLATVPDQFINNDLTGSCSVLLILSNDREAALTRLADAMHATGTPS